MVRRLAQRIGRWRMSADVDGLSAAFGVTLLMISTALVFRRGFFDRSPAFMLTTATVAVVGAALAVSGAVLMFIEGIRLS